jgi:signal transduction histidine kinase
MHHGCSYPSHFRCAFSDFAIFFLSWLCAFLLPVISSASVYAAQSPAATQQVIIIDKATLIDMNQPNNALQLSLPIRQVRSPRTFKNFKLQSNFTLANTQAQALWAVYFTSLYDGGRVSVNGIELGGLTSATPGTAVRYVRPFMVNIPGGILHDGTNQLEVEWGSHESLTRLTKMFIGPSEVIKNDYDQRYFWQNTIAQVNFVYGLVVAVILLGIYRLRRTQSNYLLMGLSAICWSVVCLSYFTPPMPSALFPYWRFIYLCTIAMLTSCSCLFIVRETQPANTWFAKLCTVIGVLGPGAYLVHYWLYDMSFLPVFELVWLITVSIPLVGYPLYTLVRALWLQWSWRLGILLFTTAVGTCFNIVDALLVTNNNTMFGNISFAVQIGSPMWLTAIAAVLVGDFVTSLTEQDNQRALMVHKLDEQQSQLTQLHEINQMREREKAALQERQRIMQDIHDGLGSQLITSLAMSERGALSKEQTSLLLRQCIDDLRLAIDTMTDTDDQFGVASGNLRFRMEPRLRAAGIMLRWDSTQFTDTTSIPASKTLPLLRIMQEAITNALKHAEASEIKVTLSADAQHLLLRISDDGKGFEPCRVRLGKGLSGMEKRARAMGAELSISGTSGTTVLLALRLHDRIR